MCKTVKERLLYFINSTGVSINTFERLTGLSQGYVKNLRKGVTEEMWERISNVYPALSKAWLLTGDGDMLRPQGIVQTATGSAQNNVNGDNVHQGDTATLNVLRSQLMAKDEQIAHLLDIISNLTKTC